MTTGSSSPAEPLTIEELANRSAIGRVGLIAWRDLDDPAAGGSEIHANRLASTWARAGLDVTIRTGTVPGLPARASRGGVEVVRAGGRFGVFVRTPMHGVLHRHYDALVEIWHGVSFLAPLWARVPTLGIAHHVHSGQFAMVLPKPAAMLAAALERSVYPSVYRKTPLVTLSNSAREQLIELGYRPEGVTAVPPGVDGRFTPGGRRADRPTLLAVARLMPQKNVDVVLRAAAHARAHHPDLELLVVGDGPERAALEAENRAFGSPACFLGRVDDAELVDLYRRAWILVSASRFEGWGMTITEAGACGTPAVVSDISGHRDAVVDGVSGVLVRDGRFGDAIAALVADHQRRQQLGAAARRRAGEFSWEESARSVFAVLADAAQK